MMLKRYFLDSLVRLFRVEGHETIIFTGIIAVIACISTRIAFGINPFTLAITSGGVFIASKIV
jgi:hypothetical protein